MDDNDEWAQLPIDPNTGVKVISIGGSNPLPVQPQVSADPASGVTYPTSPEMVDTDQTTGPLAKLFGLAGNERYQTWPEKLVRSAVTAPADAMAGKLATTTLSDDASQVPSTEIERALDMSALAGVGPLAMKPGTATLGAGLTRPAASEAAPVFYSAVENAVKDAKLNVGTADQWLGYLKNQPGVKQEELDWTLGDLPTGKLTKDDIQAHVDANKVQVQDVNKEGGIKKQFGTPEEQEAAGARYDAAYRKVADFPLDQIETPEYQNAVVEMRNAEAAMRDIVPGWGRSQGNGEFYTGPVKYSQYQLPGGTNYQEKLLTLPTTSRYDVRATEGKYRLWDNNLNDYVKTPDGKLRTGYDTQDAAKHAANGLNQTAGSNPTNSFVGSHWDEPNVLAHVRMNDRNVEGNKTLHLEEIQSDWHQKGRAEGYKITPEQKTQLESLDQKLMSGLSEADIGNPDMAAVLKTAQEKGVLTAQEAKNYADWSKGENSSIPNAPFKSTQAWSGLALKRMIRHAAENGYDALSWTPGEAQALRYQNDVRQKLDAIEWHNKSSGKVDPTGNKKLLITPAGSGNEITLTVDKNGNVVEGRPEIKGKSLDTVLGKDIAKQILEKDEGNIDAKGYVMNSEPMKKFYDEMLVNNANSIAKKYGGRVEEKEIPSTKGKYEYNGPDYTVEQLYPMYRQQKLNLDARDRSTLSDVMAKMGTGLNFNQAMALEGSKSLASNLGGNLKPIMEQQPIHFLKLPQGLKDTAMQKGFPLFAGGFPITPVQHDPFQETVQYNGKTIPINNKQDVPDLAGASSNSDTVNVDKSVPRYDPKFKLKNGENGDIYKYLAVHETEEHQGMEEDIAAFKQANNREPDAEELHRIYLKNHYGRATPAEHAAIVADGGNPKDYEDVLHGYEKKTENERSGDIPQNLYRKVYDHNQLRNFKMTPVKGNPFQ